MSFVYEFVGFLILNVHLKLSTNHLLYLYFRFLFLYFILFYFCLLQLFIQIKEWAKAQNINDPKKGTMNSYSLCLLVIFHLQVFFQLKLIYSYDLVLSEPNCQISS